MGTDYMALRNIASRLQQISEEDWNTNRRPILEQHWPGLLASITSYVTETGTNNLVLSSFCLANEHLRSILALLQGSEVTDLDLSVSSFEESMESVANLITKTKITKLNLEDCDLVDDDALCLMRILKDTKITDLNLSMNEIEFCDEYTSRKFISYLQKSHLTALNFERCRLEDKSNRFFVDALPRTSLSKLKLSCNRFEDSLARLFSKLPSMSITELSLVDCEDDFSLNALRSLATALKKSKLEKLDLTLCYTGEGSSPEELRKSKLVEKDLNDTINLLAENIHGSKLISLKLNASINSDLNTTSGSNSLGLHLRDSRIESLNLRGNMIKQILSFSYPFLEGSSVTSLNINCSLSDEVGTQLIKNMKNSKLTELNLKNNNLHHDSIISFAKIVKNTLLEDVDFSGNKLSPAAVLALGDGLKGSKVRCVNLSSIFTQPDDTATLAAFIEKIKDTPVEILKIASNRIDNNGAESISASLSGSSITHLDLSDNKLVNGVVHLATQLKHTVITQLDLTNNEIEDKGAVALAESLKESQVMELKLNSNLITSVGAIALAGSLKKSALTCLELKSNKIGTDGYEALAEQAKDTLLMKFVYREKLDSNLEAGSGGRLVNQEIFKNKILADKVAKFFDDVKPGADAQNFRFNHDTNKENIRKFLEECHEFHRIVLELPAAISILSQASQLSRNQLSVLLLEEFPKQLTSFIEREVEPSFSAFFKEIKNSIRKRSPEVNKISQAKIKRQRK